MSARGRPRLNRVGAGLEGARETAAARPPLRHRAPSSLPAARSAARAQTRYERPGADRVPGGPGGGTARLRGAAGPHPPVSGRSRGEGSARRAAGSEAPVWLCGAPASRRWRAGGAAPGARRGRWAIARAGRRARREQPFWSRAGPRGPHRPAPPPAHPPPRCRRAAAGRRGWCGGGNPAPVTWAPRGAPKLWRAGGGARPAPRGLQPLPGPRRTRRE